MKLSKFILANFILVIGQNMYAQGCSDAGFCTINSVKPYSTDSTAFYKNQIKIGISYGKADHNISVMGNYFEYNRQINDKIGIDVKLTSLAQNGNGISTFGLSDVFATANYKTSSKVNFTLGAKIPLTTSNKKEYGFSLPMDYQSSLGTFDLILGIGYGVQKLQLMAAFQQPLTQNKNRFFVSNFSNPNLRKIQETNKFERSGDILLRASYTFTINKKFKITPSLLPIYHLSNDKYTDVLNIEREINGSKGLTLNGNLYLDYTLSKKNTVQLNVGMPFVRRDSRPDGLTRSFIANLEYRYNFK